MKEWDLIWHWIWRDMKRWKPLGIMASWSGDGMIGSLLSSLSPPLLFPFSLLFSPFSSLSLLSLSSLSPLLSPSLPLFSPSYIVFRIRPDLEFRCFVNNKRITAITQYDPIGYFPHVVESKNVIQVSIFNFFDLIKYLFLNFLLNFYCFEWLFW